MLAIMYIIIREKRAHVNNLQLVNVYKVVSITCKPLAPSGEDYAVAAALLNKKIVKTEEKTISFVFPVHALTIPIAVKRFIKKRFILRITYFLLR
jgi:hypothetical protein